MYVGGPTLKLIDRYRSGAVIKDEALFRRIRRRGIVLKIFIDGIRRFYTLL